jgi:hypothetical protein
MLKNKLNRVILLICKPVDQKKSNKLAFNGDNFLVP